MRPRTPPRLPVPQPAKQQPPCLPHCGGACDPRFSPNSPPHLITWQSCVDDIVALRDACELNDDEVAEALRERAQRIYDK